MKFEVLNGASQEVLKSYPDNHFDSIVTDPPYGIEFLGKDWDSNTGAVEVWQECLRVLKPGGYLPAFSAARTYHNLATNVEQCGFEIRDQLMWIYSSGFPKAQDVGKMIEKREGKRESPWYLPGERNGCFKPQEGLSNVGKGKKENITPRCKKCNLTGGGGGVDLCQDPECIIKAPADNEWAGWKTALKPAHEPIVMARKPFKGTVVGNVLKHGTGALNIDACRVGDEKRQYHISKNAGNYHQRDYTTEQYSDTKEFINQQGRFPSNVIGEVTGYEKYFYCPKVVRKERNAGLEAANHHPTVKPVELMKYLTRLVTPPNGKILDPFNGSGSTGIAAVQQGFEYTGIELDPEYCEISKTRIQHNIQPDITAFEEK